MTCTGILLTYLDTYFGRVISIKIVTNEAHAFESVVQLEIALPCTLNLMSQFTLQCLCPYS